MSTDPKAKPSQIETNAAIGEVETAKADAKNTSPTAISHCIQSEKIFAPRKFFKPHPDVICSDH